MSIILITLLFMGSMAADPEILKGYQIRTGSHETCMDTDAMEVGGIVENDIMQMIIGSYPEEQKTQIALLNNCKATSPNENFMLQGIPSNHSLHDPNTAKNANRKICCMKKLTQICANEFAKTRLNWPKVCQTNGSGIQCGVGEECKKGDGVEFIGTIDGFCCKKEAKCDDDTPLGNQCENRPCTDGRACVKPKSQLTGNRICCGTEAKCPGGFSGLPTKEGKVPENCENVDDSLKGQGYDYLSEGGIKMCCPKLVHFWNVNGPKINGDESWNHEAFVVKKNHDNEGYVKECTKNSDCQSVNEGLFCDSFWHSKFLTALDTTAKKVCFPVPTYVGNVVIDPAAVGLKRCTTQLDCHEKQGEFCAVSGALPGNAWKDYKKSVGATTEKTIGVCFKADKCPDEPADPTLIGAVDGLEKVKHGGYMFRRNELELSQVNHTVKHSKWDDEKKVFSKDVKYTNSGVLFHCSYKKKDATAFCKKFNHSEPALGKYLVSGGSTILGSKKCSTDEECTIDDPGNFHAKCQKEGTANGFCCQERKCKNTDLRMQYEKGCTADGDCKFGLKGEGKCTLNPITKKSQCCPIVNKLGGTVVYPYSTHVDCDNVQDCLKNDMVKKNSVGLYCSEKKKCSYTGNLDGTVASTTNCRTNADCMSNNYQAVCSQNVGGTFCMADPEKELASFWGKIKDVYLWGAGVCFAGFIVCTIMSIIFFLKYRSRHFCDHRKKKKNNKKDKKKGGATKGATSEKEKTAAATAGDKTEATGAEQSGTTAGGTTAGGTTGATGGEKSGATSGAGATGATGATTGGDQSKAESVQQ